MNRNQPDLLQQFPGLDLPTLWDFQDLSIERLARPHPRGRDESCAFEPNRLRQMPPRRHSYPNGEWHNQTNRGDHSQRSRHGRRLSTPHRYGDRARARRDLRGYTEKICAAHSGANLDHRLSLIRTQDGSALAGSIINVSLKEWFGWAKTRKHVHKLWRAECNFNSAAQEKMPIDPYYLGLLLGDGSIKTTPQICTVDEEIRQAIYEFAQKAGTRRSC